MVHSDFGSKKIKSISASTSSFSICHEVIGPASVLPKNTQDWLDLLAVQGTVKSLLQHHSSKASILQRSAFFIVQLSHPYMTTGNLLNMLIATVRQVLESFCRSQNRISEKVNIWQKKKRSNWQNQNPKSFYLLLKWLPLKKQFFPSDLGLTDWAIA